MSRAFYLDFVQLFELVRISTRGRKRFHFVNEIVAIFYVKVSIFYYYGLLACHSTSDLAATEICSENITATIKWKKTATFLLSITCRASIKTKWCLLLTDIAADSEISSYHLIIICLSNKSCSKRVIAVW